ARDLGFANIEAGAALTIDALNGKVTGGKLASTAGDLKATAETIAVDDLSAAGNVDIQATGDGGIAFLAIDSGGEARLAALDGGIDGGRLAAANDVNLAGTSVDIAMLTAGGRVDAEAGAGGIRFTSLAAA